MKFLLLIFSILVFPGGRSWCQQATGLSQQLQKSKSYAVVVGISKYASKGIPKLKYANKDAREFAGYLLSKSGGSVPKENIRLLIDSNATTAAVYDAMSWLRESCHENDVVYFYFAGHGDMESETIYKLGFLLTFNTPRTNYINNAIRIEDLNNFANTLSVENKSNVILITDACHSGQLAGGGFRGNLLVGEQLRTVQSKEIRITSCLPSQLSMEDEAWGGGRGVFSYYLINGLNGLAEKESDGIVTVGEINTYLDSIFNNEPVLKQVKHTQTPFLKFKNPRFQLATIDTAKLNAVKNEVIQVMAPLASPASPQMDATQMIESVFSGLPDKMVEHKIDFVALNQLPAQEIPTAFLAQLQQKIPGLSPELLAELQNKLVTDTDMVSQLGKRLVVMIHDRGQEIINLYLSGDAAELERRRYYNAAISGYDAYPQMFAAALKLASPEDYLYHILQVNQFYFSSLAAYIKIPLTPKPAPLVEEAFRMIEKALELEKNAAYIYNMLGSLQLYKMEYAVAEKNLLKATEISPQWAIPWSNLVALYTYTKNYQKATDAFTMAKNLQPDLQNVYVNGGYLEEKQQNFLVAEELHRKSIQLNSRHYLPFERLGHVYMTTTNYAAADSFFFEADLRKQGFHFSNYLMSPVIPESIIIAPPVAHCKFDTLGMHPKDVMGYLSWGVLNLRNGNMSGAEKHFKHVIALDKTNPLAFHYLGKILYAQQRWKEGDIIFNYAVEYYLDSASFLLYVDSLEKQSPLSASRECLKKEFIYAYYNRVDDHYFLASLYENWNHFTEAEDQYYTIINETPEFIGPYHRLWNMLENIGRYQGAENIIKQFASYDPVLTNNELNAFYKRMTERFPGDGQWFYKAGHFLYDFVKTSSDNFQKDLKTILPDETEPSFPGHNIAVFNSRQDLTYTVLPGIMESVTNALYIETPYTDAITYLLKVDSLTADENILADVNDKTGDLYVWQGLPTKANAHYQKAVVIQPQNSGIRLKLIQTSASTYQLQDALSNLETLHRRKEINFPMQLLLAEYYIHTASFTAADSLLKDAQAIHPYKIPEIADLSGRRNLLSNQSKTAIKYYKDYLAFYPSSTTTMYSIARLNARSGNKNEAWKWLKTALDNGFALSYVLREDTFWEKYRNSAKWKKLLAGYTFKTYPLPQTTN